MSEAMATICSAETPRLPTWTGVIPATLPPVPWPLMGHLASRRVDEARAAKATVVSRTRTRVGSCS